MPKLILMRGASGSGKSYKAKSLQLNGGIILSTDDLFISKECIKGIFHEVYLWSPNCLGSAHKVTQEKCRVAMAQKISPVIIDNTNIKLWEMEIYIDYAKQFNYTVSYEESDTPWKNNAEICYAKNSHNVPLDVIKKQIANFEST